MVGASCLLYKKLSKEQIDDRSLLSSRLHVPPQYNTCTMKMLCDAVLLFVTSSCTSKTIVTTLMEAMLQTEEITE